MGFIKGYKDGDNITLLNTIYHRPKKQLDGKYDTGSIDIIYKDMNTNEKKLQHIEDPEYTYYMTNEGVPVDYNKLFISKNDVHPIKCKYRELKKSIAENTNNLDFFFDNLKNGNAKENDRLFYIPSVFNADMDIEDYYRWMFDICYRNEPFQPTKMYFDIEVDNMEINGNFPEPGECTINAVTIIDEVEKQVYTLLLQNYKNPLIEQFRLTPNIITELKSFVIENIGGPERAILFDLLDFNFNIIYYDEEINLIVDFFRLINIKKRDYVLAWNIAFDLPYFIARIERLGYDPAEIISNEEFPVKEAKYFIIRNLKKDKFEERSDYAQISCYSIYIDQLITFASRRKGQRAIANFKLDYVGGVIAGVRKLDYSHITTRLHELPYKDYKTFVFYNVMDTIVQLCIEKRVSDIDYVYGKCLATNTRTSKIHRQTTYLVNRGIKDFWDMNYIMGNNINGKNEKEGFVGAYVADPTLVSDKPKMKLNGSSILIADNNVDFDYKALYPSIIDENNMAPNTQHGKILIPEQLDPKENRFNNPTFNRVTWFVEDYVSGDWLTFCNRYFNLPSYEEMYDLIYQYFTTVIEPRGMLNNVDHLTGKIILCHSIPNQTRDKSEKIDKKILCEYIGRFPNNE